PSTDGRYINYCPDGWSYYKLGCFKYFRDPLTWDEAERRCQATQKGAHLAWVEEPREAGTLRRAISYYQRVESVWIGLQRDRESQTWQWTNGNKYSLASGIPGNSARGGACAMLTHQSSFTLWSSAECSREHPYVCKFYP
ncbi:REG4 protein, partial [Malurus elegans]|nr:REG4 protein [Malurus elegans]